MHLDDLIVGFDRALRTLAAPASSVRPVPGADVADVLLGDSERRHVCGLMRVNHSGEVCAQALYQGQALTSRREEVKLALRSAADEEVEHLAWTEARLGELGGRVSLLNPLWYVGSLTIGVVAGVLGDKWNLGFLAETERQVEAHLDGHLDSLPSVDLRSRAIVAQMRDDEAGHAKMAMDFGAAELPAPVRVAMKLTARFLTGLSYRI
ncbi:MAG: 2-polyprenyl-3-methyl-6-methoxy-1,4-benzoquinone monooxygenase [Azonexaceae bacterium]|nr:2-polyprenyl-3-methyl-6-methoxy-1,4-benzoquinone monooxygenase [Azonexaceae bacterium]